MTSLEFEPFPKLFRLYRTVVITEKIDGINAQIAFDDEGAMHIGTRTQWITPETDQFGFLAWATAHEDQLRAGLGHGRHFGEWWGAGLGRRYGLKEKRFSLFNTARWTDDVRPACCGVVPVLYTGIFSDEVVRSCLGRLALEGSMAVPGFRKPEGVVCFFTGANMAFKITLGGDGHKGDS